MEIWRRKLPNIRTGIFKNILKEKILMDMKGLAKPPENIFRISLYRKNENLWIF